MDLDELVTGKIRELLANRGEDPAFQPDEALIRDGRLDSLAVAELIAYFEASLQLRFSADNFNLADFESSRTMVRMLERLSSPRKGA